jgi:hypothetical protein
MMPKLLRVGSSMSEKKFIDYHSLADFTQGEPLAVKPAYSAIETIIHHFENSLRAISGANNSFFIYASGIERATSLEHLKALGSFFNRLKIDLFSAAPLKLVHVTNMSDGCVLLSFSTVGNPGQEYVRVLRQSFKNFGLTLSMVQNGDLQLRTNPEFLQNYQKSYQTNKATKTHSSHLGNGRNHVEA